MIFWLKARSLLGIGRLRLVSSLSLSATPKDLSLKSSNAEERRATSYSFHSRLTSNSI